MVVLDYQDLAEWEEVKKENKKENVEKLEIKEHVPTNWTEKMKTVWRYIFLKL